MILSASKTGKFTRSKQQGKETKISSRDGSMQSFKAARRSTQKSSLPKQAGGDPHCQGVSSLSRQDSPESP